MKAQNKIESTIVPTPLGSPDSPETIHESPQDVQVAFFQTMLAKGHNIPLWGIIEKMRTEWWKSDIEHARSLKGNTPAYDKAKLRLPSFMVSATTNGGKKGVDVTAHTGLLQLDIDKITNPIGLRDQLGADPHILAAWISPGGDGVKAIMRIPTDLDAHKKSFAAAENYILTTYGQTIDNKCKNINRLCFISSDPDLVFNEAAIVLPVSFDEIPKRGASEENSQIREKISMGFNEFYSTTSLPPESYILPPTSYITEEKFFKDWPDLKKLYSEHVVRRYPPPQRGLRHANMVEMVSSLFCVVNPEFIVSFAMMYWQRNKELFDDYPERQYRGEVKALIEGYLRDYPGRLPEVARIKFINLDSEFKKDAFRICESLSISAKEPEFPPPKFFLSCAQLGLRIGVVDMKASRLFDAFEKEEILRVIKKGERRQNGKAAIATSYEWLLPVNQSQPEPSE